MQKKQCINFFRTFFKFNIYTNMFYQFCYVTYLYSNVWPGSIGHCDIISAPFIHGVPRCNKPCQWIETVSISNALWTVIDTYWIAYKFLSWSFFLFSKTIILIDTYLYTDFWICFRRVLELNYFGALIIKKRSSI